MRQINNQVYIKLVYYVYINNQSNWRAIVSGQLTQLKDYGLLKEADLYVHITDTSNVFHDVVELIHSIKKNAVISTSSENHFEYQALRWVCDLAWQYPDSIFIYLHTKGMSLNIPGRSAEDVALLTGTFEHWRDCMELFNDKRINKIGLFPAKEVNDVKITQGIMGDWIWFNYWYARGNYLISCKPPEITTDRYLYEEWLGGGPEDQLKNDCYSIFSNAPNKYFTATEAIIELAHLANIF